MFTVFSLWLGLAHAQSQGCDHATQVADLDAGIESAIDAFRQMDLDGFREREVETREVLLCLDELLSPERAAAVHRLFAMSAFLDRDRDAATNGFRSAKAADPDGRIPDDVAPAGHPLDVLFEEATTTQGEVESLAIPPLSSAYVDGTLTTERALDRPVVLQLSQSGGIVVDTAWVDVGDASPDWSSLVTASPPEPEVEVAAEPDSTSSGSAGRGPNATVLLAGAAVAVAAGSAGLYASAGSGRAEFDDPSTPFEDLEQIRRRTNGLATASGVAAGGAVLLGATAVVLRF